MRYYGINEYRCPKDYYDNLGKGISPSEFYRKQEDELRSLREEQEAVNRKTSGMGINE